MLIYHNAGHPMIYTSMSVVVVIESGSLLYLPSGDTLEVVEIAWRALLLENGR